MKADPNDVLQAALALPPEWRQRLIDELATSLDEGGPVVTESMKRELQARDDAMSAGQYLDAESFLNHVRRR